MLDIDQANVNTGARVILWEQRDKPNQCWTNAEGALASSLNGLVLDWSSGILQMQNKTGAQSQQWRMEQ